MAPLIAALNAVNALLLSSSASVVQVPHGGVTSALTKTSSRRPFSPVRRIGVVAQVVTVAIRERDLKLRVMHAQQPIEIEGGPKGPLIGVVSLPICATSAWPDSDRGTSSQLDSRRGQRKAAHNSRFRQFPVTLPGVWPTTLKARLLEKAHRSTVLEREADGDWLIRVSSLNSAT
jgi:hypothetical protein